MLTTGHGFYAAFIGFIYMIITKNYNSLGIIMVMSAAILPDLDGISIISKKIDFNENFRHHKWPTHTFFVYILLFIAIFLIEFFIPNRIFYSILFLIGSFSHLIGDMIGSGDGIMFFWPFSKKMFGFHLLNKHGKEWLENYLSFWYFRWNERIAVALGLVAVILTGYFESIDLGKFTIIWIVLVIISSILGLISFLITILIRQSTKSENIV